MAEDWSREEVEALVADYLDMLLGERRGEEVNKAEHNRNLRNILTKRNKGSVEFKHQNVSAVLQELGYPWIEGYKPRSNYQDLLFEVVQDRLTEFPTLDEVIAAQVTAPAHPPHVSGDLLSILVAPPTVDRSARPMYERTKAAGPRVAVRRNWLEIEGRNQSLGRAGEALVARFEQERLWKAGQKKLSERVELVSVTKGDGLGYDVLSFEEDGRERFVEVKTTQFGAMTPFFASRAEVDVSVELERQYQLYRLFHFNKGPKLFTLPGSLRESCRLEPFTYAAMPG
jgi:hypothetical protein